MTNHPPHRNDHDTNHNYHSITPTAHSTAPTSAPAAQRVKASKVNIHSIIWLWLYLEPPWRKTAIHAWLLQKSFGWLLSGRSWGLGVFIFLEYWDFCIKYNGQVWHSWRSAGDAARSSGRQCVGQHWYAPPTPGAPGTLRCWAVLHHTWSAGTLTRARCLHVSRRWRYGSNIWTNYAWPCKKWVMIRDDRCAAATSHRTYGCQRNFAKVYYTIFAPTRAFSLSNALFSKIHAKQTFKQTQWVHLQLGRLSAMLIIDGQL